MWLFVSVLCVACLVIGYVLGALSQRNKNDEYLFDAINLYNNVNEIVGAHERTIRADLAKLENLKAELEWEIL